MFTLVDQLEIYLKKENSSSLFQEKQTMLKKFPVTVNILPGASAPVFLPQKKFSEPSLSKT